MSDSHSQSSVNTLMLVWVAEMVLVSAEVTGCLVAVGLPGTAVITEPVPLQIRAPGLHSTRAAAAVTCCDSSCLKDNTFYTLIRWLFDHGVLHGPGEIEKCGSVPR